MQARLALVSESAERFNQVFGDEANTSSEILPFDAGSIISAERSLALTEIKLAFSTLMPKFEIIPLQSPESVKEHFTFTISPNTFYVV
ncbi:hypothetical protein SOPP22_14765 [Shewanella sp. OPT22]|nr:hypothetical protein SOPP22_14765 [Shewanella sp. OPT22]